MNDAMTTKKTTHNRHLLNSFCAPCQPYKIYVKKLIKLGIRFLMAHFMSIIPRKKPQIQAPTKKIEINLIGLPPTSGLGMTLQSIYKSLRFKIKMNVTFFPTVNFAKCVGNINVFVGNPDVVISALLRYGYFAMYRQYTIGLWFWELENTPKIWSITRKWTDEIWVQTDFLFDIFKELNLNVHKIPFALDRSFVRNKKMSRDYFRLPKKKFIFLFAFDHNSYYERKNPEAIVRAFKKAFGDRDDVYLLIKTTHAKFHPEKEYQLKTLIGLSSNIELRDKFLSNTEQSSLLDLCDSYVSLHRSEGLGLGMAEAMSIGKPVIATNYSGNLEFMNDKNSLLVRYTKTNLKNDSYLYAKNQAWAEPDVSHAAQCMKKIKDDKGFRERISKQASKDMMRFTLKNQQQAILKRLEAASYA
jgi:glycosyltransferase involved in cell wall biosynthesis